MSFIDLYKDLVYSDVDIDQRTEDLIAAEFTAEDVVILNRKISGAGMGAYVLQPNEIGIIMRYTAVSNQAKIEGDAARADLILLKEIQAVEKAKITLLSDINDAEALLIIYQASEKVLEWVDKRAKKVSTTAALNTDDYQGAPPNLGEA